MLDAVRGLTSPLTTVYERKQHQHNIFLIAYRILGLFGKSEQKSRPKANVV